MDDDHQRLDAALYKIAEDLVEIPDACAWPPFLSKEGVPSNRTKRDSFRISMRSELEVARSYHQSESKFISAFPTLPAVDGYLEDIALDAENLAKKLGPADWAPLAARNLDDPLLGPADWARSHAREQLRSRLLASEPIAQFLSELHRDKPLVAIVEILGELAKEISITRRFLLRTKDDPATSAGYQITNIIKHLGARHVIRSLIIESDEMGNRLTFSRGTYDVKGPLIKAINILKEADNFFSHGFFPVKLRKICEDVRIELNRK